MQTLSDKVGARAHCHATIARLYNTFILFNMICLQTLSYTVNRIGLHASVILNVITIKAAQSICLILCSASENKPVRTKGQYIGLYVSTITYNNLGLNE